MLSTAGCERLAVGTSVRREVSKRSSRPWRLRSTSCWTVRSRWAGVCWLCVRVGVCVSLGWAEGERDREPVGPLSRAAWRWWRYKRSIIALLRPEEGRASSSASAFSCGRLRCCSSRRVAGICAMAKYDKLGNRTSE